MQIIAIVWISLMLSSILPCDLIEEKTSERKFTTVSNPVTVRESTVDLQVKVGEKIFVFGKAQGTLDKVKIGMHVLDFAQNPKINGIHANFHQVTWKRLKDGSVQIQSSYQPWPHQLTWIVNAEGQLKMEARSSEIQGRSLAEVGLGFDFPEKELKKLKIDGMDISQESDPKINFNTSFSYADMDFDYVSLSIRSESNPMAFEADFLDGEVHSPDLIISFPSTHSNLSEANVPGLSIVTISNPKTNSEELSKMILWFDFH